MVVQGQNDAQLARVLSLLHGEGGGGGLSELAQSEVDLMAELKQKPELLEAVKSMAIARLKEIMGSSQK